MGTSGSINSLCARQRKNVTQFNHSPGEWSQMLHLFFNYAKASMGVSGATCLWHRCLSPPKMFNQFLHNWLASCPHSFVEHSTSKMHITPLIPHNGCLGRVLPSQWDECSLIHWTQLLLWTRLNTTCNATMLQMVGQLAGCQKLTSYPLYLDGKMPLSGLHVGWALGGHPMPATRWFLL